MKTQDNFEGQSPLQSPSPSFEGHTPNYFVVKYTAMGNPIPDESNPEYNAGYETKEHCEIMQGPEDEILERFAGTDTKDLQIIGPLTNARLITKAYLIPELVEALETAIKVAQGYMNFEGHNEPENISFERLKRAIEVLKKVKE